MNYSETGHAKNVALFGELIEGVTALGGSYNPPSPELTLENLAKKNGELSAALSVVTTAQLKFKSAVTERMSAYKELTKMAVRVNGMLKASAGDPALVMEAASLMRKIHGSRLKSVDTQVKAADGQVTQPARLVSVSQQSFDLVRNHFSQLIEVVKQEANYKPNEDDLKPENLDAFITHIDQLNTSILKLDEGLNSARKNRNDLLYDSAESAAELVNRTKNYVKSIYGAGSKEYKRIASIEFRKMKN